MSAAHVLAGRARALERALAARDAAIMEMTEEGASLRAIAAAAGLSHSGVAKIVRRQTAP